MLKYFNRENFSILLKALGSEPLPEIIKNGWNKLRGRAKSLPKPLLHPHYEYNGIYLYIANLTFAKKGAFKITGYAETEFAISSLKILSQTGEYLPLQFSKHFKVSLGSGKSYTYIFKGEGDFSKEDNLLSFEIDMNKQQSNAVLSLNRIQNFGSINTNTLSKFISPNPNFYKERSQEHFQAAEEDCKLISFYLPQFHQIPENDEWWGKGFTEWTNVGKAMPKFEFHYQPRLPGELGYYDLKNEEILVRQVDLAKQYGLHAFCFHYYWFSGRKLLEMPVKQFLENKDLDLKFCINWANENWTRRWDGSENEILMKQDYSLEHAENFYKDISAYLHDPRYLRMEDQPVLLIYRPLHIPEVKAWTDQLKSLAKADGLAGLKVIGCQSIEYIDEPNKYGLDYTAQFPPHYMGGYNETLRKIGYDNSFILKSLPHLVYNYSFAGQIFNYSQVSAASYHYKPPKHEIEGLFPSWDNTARKGNYGTPFIFSDPTKYGNWLNNIVSRTKHSEHKLVFVNAWNEWAEAAYLEPDRHYGYAYLEKTAEVLAYNSENSENADKFISTQKPKAKARFAIVLHLYYVEMWKEISQYLQNISEPFDLYISLILQDEPFSKTILDEFPNADVYVLNNQGRDVGPFLQVMSKIRFFDYKYILKIHSKRSPHARNGDEWRNYSYESLMGSQALIDQIIEKFEKEANVGIVTGFKNVFSFKKWGLSSNVKPMERLALLLNIEKDYNELVKYCKAHEDELLTDWEENLLRFNENADILNEPYLFPAGTMFWFRPSALHGLFNLGWGVGDFPQESGQLDGTMAHAIERMVGLICKSNKFDISHI